MLRFVADCSRRARMIVRTHAPKPPSIGRVGIVAMGMRSAIPGMPRTPSLSIWMMGVLGALALALAMAMAMAMRVAWGAELPAGRACWGAWNAGRDGRIEDRTPERPNRACGGG
jgi:hypothetical protein